MTAPRSGNDAIDSRAGRRSFSRLGVIGLLLLPFGAVPLLEPLVDINPRSPMAGGDQVPPRIIQLSPDPGLWIVDNLGLEQVNISFSEQVVIPPAAIEVWTVALGPLQDFSATYDERAKVLSVTFPDPIRDDRLTVVLDYTITDLAGNELDGEIANPASPALPSGDGVRGGQAVIRFNILQGDVDRNGMVDTADAEVIQAALGFCIDEPGYITIADLNDDGCVNVLDVAIYTNNEGAFLPVVDEVPPALIGFELPDATTLQLSFTESIAPDRFNLRSGFLTDEAGNLLTPVSASLAPDGLSASYELDTPLLACTPYLVNVSNALADSSGMLLVPPPSPPVVGLVPPAPSLDPHTTLTNEASVTITGTAMDAASVEVSGPGGIFEVDASGGAFSADVPLAANQVNHVFFTAISACNGERSAPVSTAVTHDGEPPSLFIDFPAGGAEIQAESTDVAGRVSDMLSGFEGLTVTVNGLPAEVDIGIGTNGTFFLPGFVLVPGKNTIMAVATDVLGNLMEQQITVTRIVTPRNVHQMEMVSGSGQSGQILTVLAEPIVVHVTTPDGSDFANKVVNFEVTRSNGRLTATPPAKDEPGSMFLQVLTDVSGLAEAYWRLGSDAGCGNNRIEITSMSIAGTVAFCASATPAPAAQINIGSGNNLRGEAGGPSAEPLRVWVSDACNGLEAIPVTFRVTSGGGAVNGINEVTVNTGPIGHAEVECTLGLSPGNNVIEANFPGNKNAPAKFILFGIARDESSPTTFSGVILNNARQPIQGATCTLTAGGTTTPPVLSDIDGLFSFDSLGVSGSGVLSVDGLTAFHVGGSEGKDIPAGSYPALAYDVVLVPNAPNSLPTPVLLPPLNPKNVRSYSTTEDTELTVEEIEGLKMIVRAGSMSIDGQPAPDGTLITLNQVHHDDVPMPMPDGAAPPFAWTLQPAGAHFDPPVQIAYPNMSGLPAGSIAYFLSFNHATMRFEIVASGQVTGDGASIISDPGSGISTAGWGCNCPPYSVTGDCCKCGDCETCIDGTCVSDCSDSAVCCGAFCCDAPDFCWTNLPTPICCGPEEIGCGTDAGDGATCCELDATCCDEDCCDSSCFETCEDGICDGVCSVIFCEDCDGAGNCPTGCISEDCRQCDSKGDCKFYCEACGGKPTCNDGVCGPDTCDTRMCLICTADETCESMCDKSCNEICLNFECIGDCNPNQCERCNGDGGCETTCDASLCEECDGEGGCVGCDASCGEECVDGVCVGDCDPCEECDGVGNCENTCDLECNEECMDGECVGDCPPNECCVGKQTCAPEPGDCAAGGASLLSVTEVPISDPVCARNLDACGVTVAPNISTQTLDIEASIVDCTIHFSVFANREMQSDPCVANYTNLIGGGDPSVNADNFCALATTLWNDGHGRSCFGFEGIMFGLTRCVEIHEDSHITDYQGFLNAERFLLLTRPSMAPIEYDGDTCAEEVALGQDAIIADVEAAYDNATALWANDPNAETHPEMASAECAIDVAASICQWAAESPCVDVDTCLICSTGDLGEFTNSDEQCDDGMFCNGQEECQAGTCLPGSDPCPGMGCDEVGDVCICDDNQECDDGLFCNGAESCDAGTCVSGSNPCPGQSCNESNDMCIPFVCDSDGTCGIGENCVSCADDCITGQECGNGVCETDSGEDCLSCPDDCNGEQEEDPLFCCGDGDGAGAVNCRDPRCNSDGFACSDDPATASCCGDFFCEGIENERNCAIDCLP